jgi:MoaA/NifB/PqqE/SkfB family radical SAM enzyme
MGSPRLLTAALDFWLAEGRYADGYDVTASYNSLYSVASFNRKKEWKTMAILTPDGRVNDSRAKLADSVPLKHPLFLLVSPTNYCNLRCRFCGATAYDNPPKTLLDAHLFRAVIDDLARCKVRLKRLQFAGSGEPTLHPRIAEFVEYAVTAQVADTVEITTNGVALSEDLSRSLIDAGLNLLRVSVNGLSTEDYERETGRGIDFDKYVDRIRYFYEHKQLSTQVYVKIVNYIVPTDELRQRFIEIFDEICNHINIENLIKTTTLIDFDALAAKSGQDEGFSHGQFNEKIIPTKICPMPYYMMSLTADGFVLPCCVFPCDGPVLANARERGFIDIWQKEQRDFQRLMLSGWASACQECARCLFGKQRARPEDLIDGREDIMRERYETEIIQEGIQ